MGKFVHIRKGTIASFRDTSRGGNVPPQNSLFVQRSIAALYPDGIIRLPVISKQARKLAAKPLCGIAESKFWGGRKREALASRAKTEEQYHGTATKGSRKELQ